MASLKFDITGNANGFVSATRQAEAAAGTMTRKVSNEGAALDSMFKKLAGSVAAIGAGFSATKLISDIVRVRGEFQQLEIAMETMLGSTEKASSLMGQLTSTAAKTPFGLTDIAQGAKQLLAYGTASEEVNDTLVRLGNIASGLSIPLNDLVYLYGTTQTQGRLFTQDLRQFMGRGIPIADELAKQFGVTKDKVGELVTAGKVGFPEVQKAIESLTNEGGKFYNLMEKQSSSLTGQISNLEDNFDMMLNEIGTKMQDTLASGISLAASLIENYEKIGRTVAAIAATYGTYRAATIAVTVAEKAAMVARLASIKGMSMLRVATGLLAKQMGVLNVIMSANPYVLLATAVVGLGTAMWALSDKTTAAERAQKSYNKQIEEAAAAEKRRQDRIEDALETVRDSNNADAERISALMELKREYPNIFNQYDIEKLKLADILEIKKQIAEEDRNRKGATMEEQYAANQQWLNEHRQTYNSGGKAFRKSYETKQEEQKLLRQDYTDQKVEDYIAGIGEMSTEYLQKVLAIAQRAEAGNARFLLEGTKVMAKGSVDLTSLKRLSVEGENLASVIEAINAEIAKRNETVPSYGDTYKKAEEEWKQAKEKLEAIKKDRAKYTEKEYKEAAELEKSRREAFEDLGGDTKGTQKKKNEEVAQSEQKAAQIRMEYANKALRQQEDIDNMREQAEIDALKDGAEKKRRQLSLDHVKELQQLRRQQEDFIDAAVERDRALFEAEENVKASKDSSYVKGTFDEDASRAKRSAEADAMFSPIIKKTEARQRREEAEAIKEINDEVLGDFKTYFQKRKDIADKYAKLEEKFYKKDESGNVMVDANGNKVFRDGVSQANVDELNRQRQAEELAVDTQFAEREAEYQAWMNTITDYTMKQLESALAIAEQKLAEMEASNPNDPDIAMARAQVGTLRKKVENKNAEAEVAPNKRSIEEWNDLREALEDCVSAFDEIGEAIGGVAGEVVSTAGTIASSSLNMINGIVQLVNMSNTGMTATAATASSAISTVEKASVILAVISAALQIVMSIVNAVKNAINKAHAEKIEEITNANEELDKSYQALERSIEKAYSVDASKLIEQQNVLLEQKKKNLQLLIAEEKARKNADEEQIKEWQNQIDGIETTVEDNAEKAKEAINGITFDGFRENFLDALLDMEEGAEGLAESIEEDIRKAMYEALLTDDAFENQMKSLYDDLADAIEAGDTREIDRIKSAILNLYDMQEEKAREIDEKLGYEASSSRSASEKGIAQASQSSVDELNGRATAIQSHTFSINQHLASLVSINAQILGRVSSIDGKASRLEAIERSLDYMRSDISDIVTRGINVKA